MQQLYILSKDFKELGPISYPELLALKPKAKDMVWEIGKSNSWKFFNQIDPPAEQAELPKKVVVPEPVLKPKEEAPLPEKFDKYLPKTALNIIPKEQKKEVYPRLITEPKKNIEPPLTKQTEQQPTKPLPRTTYEKAIPNKHRSEWLGKTAVALFILMIGVGGYFYFTNNKTSSIQYPKIYTEAEGNDFKEEIIEPSENNATQTNFVAPDDVAPANNEPEEDIVIEKPEPEKIPEEKAIIDEEKPKATTIRKPEVSNNTQKSAPQPKPTVLENKPPQSEPQPKPKPQSNSQPETQSSPQPIIQNPGTEERTRRTRNQSAEIPANEPEHNSANEPATTIEKSPKTNSNGALAIKSNQYTKVAFGGIRNLKLIVTNNSAHTMKNVEIELVYLKKNNKQAKIKQLKLRELVPNGEAEITVPDTNYGSEINYTIVSSETSD